MKKSSDELLSRLLHIGDAPSIAPGRADASQATDHFALQSPPLCLHADSGSPMSSEKTAAAKSEGLGIFLLGSMLAFAAISAVSTIEVAHGCLQAMRRRLRDGVEVVLACAKACTITTLKLVSQPRVSTLIRMVWGNDWRQNG